MTNYITAEQVAATIRKVLELEGGVLHTKADLITEFAVGFFPDSPSAQRAFVRQCVPDDQPAPQYLGSYPTTPVPGVPDEEVLGVVEETAPLKCCYIHPTTLAFYDGVYFSIVGNPCTADAVWAIHEQGEPYDIISYACDKHLVALLGHESEEPEESSMIFEVYPLKVQLPFEPDPTSRDFEESGDTSHWEVEESDDEGGFYEPSADADCYEDAPDSGTEREEKYDRIVLTDNPPEESRFERFVRLRDRMEQDPHYIPSLDRTGPANDPPDYAKQFEEMMRKCDGYPVEDVGESDTVKVYIREFPPLDEELPMTERYSPGVDVEHAKAPGKLHSYPVEPDEEKEGVCCETHEALAHVLRALELAGTLIEARSKLLTNAHFDEELGDLKESPFPKGFFYAEEELLTCEICGGGGLTKEYDFCFGCYSIVCLRCGQRAPLGIHKLEDHYPERDLRFVAD